MAKILGHAFFFYPKFLQDIWGESLLGLEQTNLRKYRKVTQFFFRHFRKVRSFWSHANARYVYHMEQLQERQRKKKINKSFSSIRLVRLFYLILTYKAFKALARKAHQKDGYFEGHYCLALEGRLVTMVYRSGFVATMFEALGAVRRRLVTVNKRLLDYPNQQLKLYHMVSFHPLFKKRAYFNLWVRIALNRRSLFNGPRYLYLSHWFLFSFMITYPLAKDLAMPKAIDIYRATGYGAR